MLYEISEKIYQLEKQGKKITKLNLGEPEWRAPDIAKQALIESVGRGRYASAAGESELREAISSLHGCESKNVVIMPGSKWGVFAIFRTVLKPGDNIIVLSPHWIAYEAICNSLNVETKKLKLRMEDNWKIDFEALENTVDSKTRIIVLNSPCNPTSHAWTENEERKIIELAKDKGIFVLVDDAYRDLCFEKRKERQMDGGLLLTNSLSKTFGMTGWRVGYIIVPDEIAERIIKFNQITITNVPVFSQAAALKALEQKEAIADKNRELSKNRADIATKMLSGKMEFSAPNAGFYLFPRINMDAGLFTDKLLDKGVAVVPGSAFGGYDRHFRISLCAEDDVLKSALHKMIGVLE